MFSKKEADLLKAFVEEEIFSIGEQCKSEIPDIIKLYKETLCSLKEKLDMTAFGDSDSRRQPVSYFAASQNRAG